MRTICILLTLLTSVFYGCDDKDKGMDDSSKRNENWVWFVDKASGQGAWIPIGKNSTLQNGNYTAFYFNGKIREKGKLVETHLADTAYYFDLNEKLTKYNVLRQDSSIHYYVNEGPYKAYSPKGEIVVEGIVKDHKLAEIKWYGAMAHFIKIFVAITPALVPFNKFAKELLTEMKLTETHGSLVPSRNLKRTDSLFVLAKQMTDKSLEELSRIQPFLQMPDLEVAAKDNMTTHLGYLNNQYSEIIALSKKGLGKESRNKIQSIIQKMLETNQTEKIFSKAQTDFLEKFEIDEEQSCFLNDRYKYARYERVSK